jgi:glycerol-3-phosphate acyltransferase PlsX
MVMTIAVDAMGGDDAPAAPVAGAVAAAREGGASLLLVGDTARIEAVLASLGAGRPSNLDIVHADEVVGMEDAPITPIRRKPRSSIRICAELVKQRKAQAMVTAGNTGAAMIAAKLVIGTSPGVDRPALAAVLPNLRGFTVVLDVGANVDSKPSQMRQFAVMGHFFAQQIVGTESPRIGLLSVGEEEGKGSGVTREAFKVLRSAGLNFVGNVEGGDVFKGTVDVIVCDGFVGNVVLKSAEALAETLTSMLREEMAKSVLARVGYLLARPAFRGFRRRIDYSEYGAAPLLGIEGGCFIGHGRSSPKAIANAIRRAREFAAAGLQEKVSAKLRELHQAEQEIRGPEEVSTP